jgi:hypothetical protein
LRSLVAGRPADPARGEERGAGSAGAGPAGSAGTAAAGKAQSK